MVKIAVDIRCTYSIDRMRGGADDFPAGYDLRLLLVQFCQYRVITLAAGLPRLHRLDLQLNALQQLLLLSRQLNGLHSLYHLSV